MAETEFIKEQLIKFLTALDSLLEVKTKVTVIGGTAVILGYGIERGTVDIDWWMSTSKEIKDRWAEAVKNSGVEVKLDIVGVGQAPESFEERLIPLANPKFKHLEVFYPEAHDLVIMKLCRNVDIDAADIQALHNKVSLNPKILLDRFLNDFTYVGRQAEIDVNYVVTIEDLFGQEVADSHKQKIDSRRSAK